MTRITISNTGGTLNCDAIEHGERQACNVAVRSVSLRTSGSFVDTGTWTLKNRRLNMTIRLTNSEKTTLQAIFDENVIVTITMKPSVADYIKWTYIAWFVVKPLIYEYSVDVGGGNTREWVGELEFVVETFSFSTKVTMMVVGRSNLADKGAIALYDIVFSNDDFTITRTRTDNDISGGKIRAVSSDGTTYYLCDRNDTELWKYADGGWTLVDNSTIYSSDGNHVIFIKYNGTYFLIGTVDNYGNSRIYKYDGTSVTLLGTINDRWFIDASYSSTLGKWLIVGEEIDGGARHHAYYTYDGSSFVDVTATINYRTGENERGPRGVAWFPKEGVFVITGMLDTVKRFVIKWTGSGAATLIDEDDDTKGEAIWEAGEHIILNRIHDPNDTFYWDTWTTTGGLTNDLFNCGGDWRVELEHRQHGGMEIIHPFFGIFGETCGEYGAEDPTVRGLWYDGSSWHVVTPDLEPWGSVSDAYVLATCVSNVVIN